MERGDNVQDPVAVLFAAHYAPLCRLAALLVGDRARAEELVMDAFAASLPALGRLRDEAAAPAYLRRAVVNATRTHVRRRHVERRVLAVVAARTPASVEADHGAALAGPVLAALAALPPRQRAAVVLTYWLDLAEADVADALGCAPGTVKSQLSKARATLAGLLAEEDPRG